MATEPAIQRAFLGGELSPAFGARADLARYAAGLGRCRNFFVRREGGVVNRAGTYYLATAGVADATVRLIPFVFEAANQTFLIEAGDGYFRFFFHGAAVVDGMDPLEVSTPYAADDLPLLQWAQSADVISLTHDLYPPMELLRHAADDWELITAATEPAIVPPASGLATPFPSGTVTHRYVITVADRETFEESLPSEIIVAANVSFPTRELPRRVSCAVQDDAGEYYVYCDRDNNNVFGFLGTMTPEFDPTTHLPTLMDFHDIGKEPDLSLTPPIAKTQTVDGEITPIFTTAGNYPAVSTYYQQRKFYARTLNDPERVWGTRVGQYDNLTISSPLQDSDAVEFTIASKRLNPVHHMLDLERLMLFSDEAEWIIAGDEAGTITPTDFNPRKRGFAGTHYAVPPEQAGNGAFHVQGRGTIVRDLRLEQAPGESSVISGRDLTEAARHLFDGYTVRAMAWQQIPLTILWVVRSDGLLLACTYDADTNVAAWSQHDTDGLFEDVLVLPDTIAGEDIVYLVVNRGGTRFIEKMMSRFIPQNDDAKKARATFFMDAGLTYEGAAATVITGLDHLEGKTVAAIVNAVDKGTFTVTGGAITLPVAGTIVNVGLEIPRPELQTLQLDADGSTVRDKKKRIQGLSLVMYESDPSVYAGPDADHLTLLRREQWVASGIISGTVQANIPTTIQKSGQTFIAHAGHTPLHILAVIPQIDVVP